MEGHRFSMHYQSNIFYSENVLNSNGVRSAENSSLDVQEQQMMQAQCVTNDPRFTTSYFDPFIQGNIPFRPNQMPSFMNFSRQTVPTQYFGAIETRSNLLTPPAQQQVMSNNHIRDPRLSHCHSPMDLEDPYSPTSPTSTSSDERPIPPSFSPPSPPPLPSSPAPPTPRPPSAPRPPSPLLNMPSLPLPQIFDVSPAQSRVQSPAVQMKRCSVQVPQSPLCRKPQQKSLPPSADEIKLLAVEESLQKIFNEDVHMEKDVDSGNSNDAARAVESNVPSLPNANELVRHEDAICKPSSSGKSFVHQKVDNREKKDFVHKKVDNQEKKFSVHKEKVDNREKKGVVHKKVDNQEKKYSVHKEKVDNREKKDLVHKKVDNREKKDSVQKVDNREKKDLVHKEKVDNREKKDLVHKEKVDNREKNNLVHKEKVDNREKKDFVHKEKVDNREKKDSVHKKKVNNREKKDFVHKEKVDNREKKDSGKEDMRSQVRKFPAGLSRYQMLPKDNKKNPIEKTGLPYTAAKTTSKSLVRSILNKDANNENKKTDLNDEQKNLKDKPGVFHTNSGKFMTQVFTGTKKTLTVAEDTNIMPVKFTSNLDKWKTTKTAGKPEILSYMSEQYSAPKRVKLYKGWLFEKEVSESSERTLEVKEIIEECPKCRKVILDQELVFNIRTHSLCYFCTSCKLNVKMKNVLSQDLV